MAGHRKREQIRRDRRIRGKKEGEIANKNMEVKKEIEVWNKEKEINMMRIRKANK